MIGGIKDAIVEILTENANCNAWATGGIHVRRAPPMPKADASRRRDRYIVVRVAESDPEHQQVGPSTLTTDQLEISVWAKSSTQADEGANLVRVALDGFSAQAAGINVQRIFWRGTVDREVEDASGAEQLIDGAFMEFDVGYTLPT
jgi:hypothetical protein